MKSIIEKHFDSFVFLEPLILGAAAVLPFHSEMSFKNKYINLNKALGSEGFECKEISESGTVSTIKCFNKTKSDVLIVEGEELVGAKQNRVLNITILIKKGSEIDLPVSCVQQGRWSKVSESFQMSETMATTNVKKILRKSVREHSRDFNSIQADQSGVWEENLEFAKRVNYNSPTGALNEMIAFRNAGIKDDFSKLTIEGAANGFVFFENGDIEIVEFISDLDAFSDYYNKAIKSILADSDYKGEKQRTIDYHKAAREFFIRLRSIEYEPEFSLGLGGRYTSEIDDKIATMLIYKDEVINFSVV